MNTKILDWLGISAAVLCLIHCLFFPVLMIISSGIENSAYIDAGFLVIGILIVYRITTNIKSKKLKYTFWTAIVLIAVSVLLDLFFHIYSPLIYVGAVLLIMAHIINFKNHKH